MILSFLLPLPPPLRLSLFTTTTIPPIISRNLPPSPCYFF
jgi:hypothetical protein